MKTLTPAVSGLLTPLTVSIGGALILAGLLSRDHSMRQADKAAHAQICRGTYPFPVITLSGSKRRHLVRVVDVESTLARLAGSEGATHLDALHQDDAVKRPRGRPRKAARDAVRGR